MVPWPAIWRFVRQEHLQCMCFSLSRILLFQQNRHSKISISVGYEGLSPWLSSAREYLEACVFPRTVSYIVYLVLSVYVCAWACDKLFLLSLPFFSKGEKHMVSADSRCKYVILRRRPWGRHGVKATTFTWAWMVIFCPGLFAHMCLWSGLLKILYDCMKNLHNGTHMH